ncbi:hypothetical protein NEUTE1DRAFT_90554 [Neurospora tetrasperma FGSC 2508]|uniref:Rhodopsin domain-containing protein n=1 Tax=Neurospora tetrasperma (strain FGSC 2508 / ATCC MYA-4615 / P0657) TaxID=510951 RepID=F8N1T6_NEUT8|nr:uncharacterized protein NEUTE1DRAFT_90554 [Neurospora tetrasperma FGSC 2508]EGO52363.1 hypothetical protein NEUTE1DRAFT_90554 [Neurospora tetrasperma FGSC 2508]
MTVYVPPSSNPQGAALLAIFWSIHAACTIFVGLRLYCKVIRGRCLWWDDHLLIVAWALLFVNTVFTSTSVLIGYGLHTDAVPAENEKYLSIIGGINGTTSVLHVLFSKVSFAVTLLRITDGWLKRLVWFIIITLTLCQVSTALLFWLLCEPPEATWNSSIMNKKCWSPDGLLAYSIALGIYSAVCDFVLALLPWRILMRFHMYRGEKVGVAIAMSMGVFAGIAGAIKVSTIGRIVSNDFSYEGFLLVVCALVEGACAMMAASIPTLRALFLHTFDPPSQPSIDVAVESSRSAGASARRARSDWDERKYRNRSDQSILAIPPTSSSTMDRSVETDIERDLSRPLNNQFEMKDWKSAKS